MQHAELQCMCRNGSCLSVLILVYYIWLSIAANFYLLYCSYCTSLHRLAHQKATELFIQPQQASNAKAQANETVPSSPCLCVLC